MPSLRLRRCLATAAAAIAAVSLVSLPGPATSAEDGKTTRLFNGKNFDGWYIFIRGNRQAGDPERIRLEGEGKTEDPHGIFKVERDGSIYVSGRLFGYLSTDKEYENYRFKCEFKWGDKRWPPRENVVRDAGVLYHAVGEDKVWMKSLEFQIQEQDCGDMWLTGGEGGAPSLTVKGKKYTGGRVVKFSDHEKPKGEWNQVEVVCQGDKIQHFMNGKLNMEGTEASLTKGKINLQSEGAELWYRNITLEPIRN